VDQSDERPGAEPAAAATALEPGQAESAETAAAAPTVAGTREPEEAPAGVQGAETVASDRVAAEVPPYESEEAE
jgi:hypothetical protein